jgi:hypothetical protein
MSGSDNKFAPLMKLVWFLAALVLLIAASGLVYEFDRISGWFVRENNPKFGERLVEFLVIPFVVGFASIAVAAFAYSLFLRRLYLDNAKIAACDGTEQWWVDKGIREEIKNACKDALNSPPLVKRNLDSDVKNDLKEILFFNLSDRHRRRINVLNDTNAYHVYDFRDHWGKLLEKCFEHNCILRDFSLGHNASQRFDRYDFQKYYSDVLDRGANARDSNSSVRFLVLCSAAPLWDSEIIKTSKPLEIAIYEILKRIRLDYDLQNAPLSEVYEAGADDSGRRKFSLRLVDQSTLGRGRDLLKDAFNVYGHLAVSVSKLGYPHPDEPDRPLPHLEVYLREEKIKSFEQQFDEAWDLAESVAPYIAKTMTSWEEGEMLKKWSDPRNST